MPPVIRFNEQTRELLKKTFGIDSPFIVVRRERIIEDDKPFGDRVYLNNGIHTVTVPNVQGLDFGDKLYLAEDMEVYEWHSHFGLHPNIHHSVSNNQKTALSFGLHPIIYHKDSRNS